MSLNTIIQKIPTYPYPLSKWTFICTDNGYPYAEPLATATTPTCRLLYHGPCLQYSGPY